MARLIDGETAVGFDDTLWPPVIFCGEEPPAVMEEHVPEDDGG